MDTPKIGLSEEDFERFRRFVEYKILPLTDKMSLKDRNHIRNQIRFSKSIEELERRIYALNERFSLELDIEELAEFFNNENKTRLTISTDFSNKELKPNSSEEINPEYITALIADPKTKKQGIYLLSQHFIHNHNLFTFQDSDEIYLYKDGFYIPSGDKIISSETQILLGDINHNNLINELMGHIRRSTYKKREDIQEPKDKICLSNGILNLNTLEVEPHTPSVIFFNKLSVGYDLNADCPTIKRFLSEVVSEQDIFILQEIIGYCLYKDYQIHKAFMLVGSGANGKSTFINLIRVFLGQPNCSSVSLQQLETNRFALASLHGKLANLFADLSPRALKETSCFKMLAGEDLVPAEKKFQNQFFFLNYAKMIFSCNQIPKSPDDSDAFFRRWVIIIFPNQFLDGKADKRLIQKLTTPEELSGLLNFALGGLRRLLQHGEFSYSKSINDIREVYIRQSDSVGAFIMDCVEIKPEDYIEKKKLYTAYADYCRNKNYPIVPENTFHRDLQANIRVEDYRPNLDIDGKKQRVQCWRGVKFDKSKPKVINSPDNTDIPDGDDTKTKENVNPVNDVNPNSNFSTPFPIEIEDVKNE